MGMRVGANRTQTVRPQTNVQEVVEELEQELETAESEEQQSEAEERPNGDPTQDDDVHSYPVFTQVVPTNSQDNTKIPNNKKTQEDEADEPKQ